jgi:hypothetical protein
MLRISLLLARELVGVQLPSLLADQVERDAAARSIARTVAMLWGQPPRRVEGLSLAYARSYVRTRERLRDRLWFYLHLALVPGVADWRVVALPEALAFAYYLVRPARLAWEYGPSRYISMNRGRGSRASRNGAPSASSQQ